MKWLGGILIFLAVPLTAEATRSSANLQLSGIVPRTMGAELHFGKFSKFFEIKNTGNEDVFIKIGESMARLGRFSSTNFLHALALDLASLPKDENGDVQISILAP